MTYELQSTSTFDKWLKNLKDKTSKQKLLARLERAKNGNFGDYKNIENNLYELRFFFAGGFRIYYTIKNGKVIL
jgi:putative addiction module killer protein